ncbi:unnamed protein product [Allacma fusca]|uniref:Uncharacterized protein n=1 Tax=Allacma fusca TaxID=39272 RepID=A0A8J2L3A8_9HEXA|nr:unnamed protein product [Allacma fusca]
MHELIAKRKTLREEEEEHQKQCDDCVDRCDEVELNIQRILRGWLGGRSNQNRRLSRNQKGLNEVSTKLPKIDITKFSEATILKFSGPQTQRDLSRKLIVLDGCLILACALQLLVTDLEEKIFVKNSK